MAVDEENDDDAQNNNEYHDVRADDTEENEDDDHDDGETEEDNQDDEEEEDSSTMEELEEVSYPDVVSKDGLIKNLTDHCFIDCLICTFKEDENWDGTKNLRRTLLRHQDKIGRFVFYNNYNENKDTRKKCLKFFLKCLTKYSETPDMINGSIEYNTPYSSSMTLEEAQRLASTIGLFDSEHSKHVALVLSGDMILFERGTFACIFNSIVDNGTLEDFRVCTIRSIVDLEHGCIGRSNLATNTTLKRLSFENFGDGDDDQFFDDEFGKVTVVDDAVRELASALRRNTGLESIDLDSRMLTNVGRQALLDSLRDNCTLTELSTNSGEVVQNDTVSLRLQSEIDDHMKLNKFWSRIQNFPYMDTKTKGVTIKYRKKRNMISVQVYPDVIEVLATKPLLLYTFLRNDIDHTPLFGGKPPRRRRSARVRKKRRLVGRLPPTWQATSEKKVQKKQKQQQTVALAAKDDDTIPLTLEEQEFLTEAIPKLAPDRLCGFIQMLRDAAKLTGDDEEIDMDFDQLDTSTFKLTGDDEEIDLDFDQLDTSTQRKLLRYVTKL